MKLVMLSGPPRSGKDVAAMLIGRNAPGTWLLDNLSRELKERTHGLFRLYMADRPGVVPHFAFEKSKDTPSEFFLGQTPREAYIGVLQKYLIPTFGTDVLARLALSRLESYITSGKEPMDYYLVSDVGRQSEARALVAGREWSEIHHIRIERSGCEYTDGREPVLLEQTAIVNNAGFSAEALLKALQQAAPRLFIQL